MRTLMICLTSLGLAAPFTLTLAATDDASSTDKGSGAEQFDKIVAEYDGQRTKAAKAFAAAANEQEKARALAEEPKIENYTSRILALVAKHRHEEFAYPALFWVAKKSIPSADAERALDLLLQDHSDSKQLGEIAELVLYSGSPSTERRLRTILEKSPHHNVQGMACLCLARFLKMKPESMEAPSAADVAGCNREAEAMLKRVSEQYGDVSLHGRKVKDLVDGERHEIHDLTIGKGAPDIDAQDIHGRQFKLSDYRGKVVMLDFWGHW